MELRKFFLMHIQIYCVLVTLIFAVSMVFGMIYAPEENIKYYQLAGPFIMAALCVLPSFITYFKSEPTLKQYIIRHIIQLTVIEAIVLLMVQPPDDMEQTFFRLFLGSIVLVVYMLVKLAVWLQKYLQSRQLADQLRKFQSAVIQNEE